MVLNDRNDLIALLQQKNSRFSEVFHRIAGFVLTDYYRACFMTAQELASAVGVSQPSVTRFTTFLGFSGFPEFQRSLQRIVRGEMTGLDRMRVYAEQDDMDVPYADLVRQELENVTRLTETFSTPEFKQVAAALAQADDVVVAGFRASSALAVHAGFFLAKVRPGVHVLTAGDLLAPETLLSLDPERTSLLIYAFPRYAREAITFRQLASAYGFAANVITDNPLSPLVAGAQHVLIAPVGFESLFDSYSAPFLLSNALVQETTKQNPRRTQQRLARFEEFARDQRLFASGAPSTTKDLPGGDAVSGKKGLLG